MSTSASSSRPHGPFRIFTETPRSVCARVHFKVGPFDCGDVVTYHKAATRHHSLRHESPRKVWIYVDSNERCDRGDRLGP